MMRILCRIIGLVLCLFGIIGMLTPIPLGILPFVLGLLFLIPTTPSAARVVRGARRKFRIFDRLMSATTNRLPYPYRRVLRETEVKPDW